MEMLILSRKINEVVRIRDDIKITVLGVNRNHIRLGIEAPNDVPVHRAEIWERIHGRKDNSKNGDKDGTYC